MSGGVYSNGRQLKGLRLFDDVLYLQPPQKNTLYFIFFSYLFKLFG